MATEKILDTGLPTKDETLNLTILSPLIERGAFKKDTDLFYHI